jgi:hypothetical protein
VFTQVFAPEAQRTLDGAPSGQIERLQASLLSLVTAPT